MMRAGRERKSEGGSGEKSDHALFLKLDGFLSLMRVALPAIGEGAARCRPHTLVDGAAERARAAPDRRAGKMPGTEKTAAADAMAVAPAIHLCPAS